jgi:hypothetical protein
MFNVCKDRYIEIFKFLEDGNGEWIKDKNGRFKTKSEGKKKNPVYIPGALRKRPKWCVKKFGKTPKKDMISSDECVFDKCPFCSLCDITKHEYQVMIGAWEKASNNHEFDKDYEDTNAPTSNL